MTTNNWIVIAKDMDGIIGYQVVHQSDAADVRYGVYLSNVAVFLTRDCNEANRVAEEYNLRNEPAPENPFRGAFGR